MTYHEDMDSFIEKYERGKAGKNKSIPMGFKRLTKHVGLRSQVYYLVGGYTGSAKTTLIDDAFVLNPIYWYIQNRQKSNFELKIIYFSQERSKAYKIARWISRTLFMNEGIILPIDIILGWEREPNKEEQEYIDRYLPYISSLFEDIIEIHEGPKKPGAMFRIIKEFAESRGEETEKEFTRKNGTKYKKKVYIPDNPNELVIIVVDTINLTVPENKEDGSITNSKETIDKASEYMRMGRDKYGYSPVVVSQFNREIANPMRLKAGDVQPQLEDFSGSAGTQNDAEVIMALFDPMRYKVSDVYGYDLEKLKEGEKHKFPGSKKYRQLTILKNSYGADDIGIGLALQPQSGLFKELPFPSQMTDNLYESVLDNTFFVTN